MRILMLAQFYAPTIGGEERLVQDLALALVRRGHAVSVATLWDHGLPEFEVDRGVRIYRLKGLFQRAGWLYQDPGRRHAPPLPDPAITWALRQVVKAERPDIVHGHNWLVYSYLPLKAVMPASLVMTLHDYSLVCPMKRLMHRGAPCSGPGLRKCLGCAGQHYGPAKGIPTTLGNRVMAPLERAAVDLFLPISQAVADASGLSDGCWPYQVIPNFVPDALLQARCPEETDLLAQLPEGDYLLFVGDLSPDKGTDILLQAYGRLSGAPPLVMIGRSTGSPRTDLPANVIMLPKWPHAAVMAAWRRSTIALVPSVWAEPFGLVALEAMAAGRPLIASRTGGLADIVIDGTTGLLVPPGDVDALHAAMTSLLANVALRSSMGVEGRLRAETFTESAILPRIERAYRTVARSGLPRAQPEEEQGQHDFE